MEIRSLSINYNSHPTTKPALFPKFGAIFDQSSSPALEVDGIKSVPSVCLCQCVYNDLLVTALTTEPFGIRTQNLVGGIDLDKV